MIEMSRFTGNEKQTYQWVKSSTVSFTINKIITIWNIYILYIWKFQKEIIIPMFLTSFKHFFYTCHGFTCTLILMNEGVRFQWSYLCLCLYNTADITSNEQPQSGQFSLATGTLERFSSWLQWYTPLLSGAALVNPENHPRGWRWRPNHLRSATCLVSSRRVRCLWLFAPFLVGRTPRHPSYPAFWWMENNGPPGIRRCYFVRPRNPIDRIEWRVVPENQPSPVKSPRQRNFRLWFGM